MRDFGVKIVRQDRLLWFKEKADENHWHRRFADTITTSHKQLERSTPKLIRILISSLPTTGKILEAGCGTGWVVAALRNHGFDVEGVDFSNELIQAVKMQYPELPVSFADVCQLTVPDGYYQAYVSLGVIEHREAGPEPFLTEAHRVLGPDGILCVSVPHYNFLRQIKRKFGGYRELPNGQEFYQYGFTRQEFARILTRSGFHVLRFENYGTERCFQEELPRIHGFLKRRRFLWRLPRMLDRLDGIGSAHMIMAVAVKS